jgi:hypothetical protein
MPSSRFPKRKAAEIAGLSRAEFLDELFQRRVPVSDVWVLNASPVILLGKIGRLDLMESLAVKAVVPNAVFLVIQAGIGERGGLGCISPDG